VRMQELLADVEVEGLQGDPAVDVGAVTVDSRAAGPGALFACIPGEHVDGHDKAPEALAAGAVALLVERTLGLTIAGRPVTEVRVADVRAAIGPIAARFYGFPSTALDCLGVTGTNGKTTVTYLLEAIARAAGRRPGVIGTTGVRMEGAGAASPLTTPEATDLQALLARMRDEGLTAVAMEVSSHALAQRRVDGTSFRAACFTNLSHDHLDFHGDVESYFEAKARLFTSDFTRCAAVNVDDEHGRILETRARAAGLDVVTYAIDAPADVTARDITIEAEASTLLLEDRRARATQRVRVPLVGRHNVANAVAAAATALAAGWPFDAIVAGVEHVATVPGRLERIDAGQPFLALVDYAHTPDALTHALRAARELAGDGRVVVVIGCGGDRDREKRPEMGAVASDQADVAIITSDNPRSERAEDIADAMVTGATGPARVIVELDRRTAIRTSVSEARPGDVVVIAGKGHEPGQTANGVTMPFDDREVTREALGELSWS
jgi:UDP-N-acetylmuramoyl-L-alanyl-D-glutamate--2,6-diaminopimelate ligase